MNRETDRHPLPRFLVRHDVEFLALLVVLFVLQTGLVPFDFGQTRPQEGSRVLFGTPISHLTYTDIISNIFLYVPVGMFLYWTLRRWLRFAAPSLLLTLLSAGGLSLAVEWLQSYSPTRVSSLIDLVSNLLGAGVGVMLAWILGGVAPAMVKKAVAEFHLHPRATIVKAYCLTLFLFAAIPFSISFDVSRLKQAVKSANLVPFAMADTDQVLAEVALENGDAQAFAHLRWQFMKRWSRWAAECASFVVLGWLLFASLRADYGFGGVTSALLVFWLAFMMAVGLSVVNFLVISRSCDVTDILFRLAGVCVGLVVRTVYVGDEDRYGITKVKRRWRRLARVGVFMTAGFILYNGVIPGLFSGQGGGVLGAIRSDRFLPFFSYFLARFDIMMDDVMDKFASYAVLAVLLAASGPAIRSGSNRTHLLRITLFGLLLAASIEIIQIYIPVRVTSLTDLILAAAGCMTGALGYEHGLRFYHSVLESRQAAPVRIPDSTEPSRRLSPFDAMIATLMEPDENAPRELASPTTSPRQETTVENDETMKR